MNKKLSLLLLLVSSIACFVSAQTPKDTLNLRDKHYVRQAMYETNQEAFAPPRKNNWSLGLQGGVTMVSGDIRPLPGWGFGFNVRKALGHSFSLRLQASMGSNTGQNWRANGGFNKNTALNGAVDTNANYTNLAYQYVYYNYKTNFQEAGLQGVWNIGNINFHNREPKVSFYTFFGLGMMAYNTKINALDANGQAYDYGTVIPPSQLLSDRKTILGKLDNLMDNTYETQAESHLHKNKIGSSTLIPAANVGLGLDFKMSRRVSLALEYRITWTGDDLIDGQRWEETNTLTANGDYMNYATVGFNFRIGKGEESYWFQNPLSTIYSDVRDLKRFNKSGEKDSDNDGVVDSRDKEKGTPEGVMVDGQGRAMDSDGDGIKDFNDKEPFSPKGAQVDGSGVSKDSDGDGVIDFYDEEPGTVAGAQADANGKAIAVKAEATAADITPFDMVNFDLASAEVKQEYYPAIYQVARYLSDHPEKSVVVIGNADNRGKSDKNDNLSKDRANNVAKILFGNFGIAKERIKIDYKGDKEQLVKGLPSDHEKAYEALHFLNRRVEFQILD